MAVDQMTADLLRENERMREVLMKIVNDPVVRSALTWRQYQDALACLKPHSAGSLPVAAESGPRGDPSL